MPESALIRFRICVNKPWGLEYALTYMNMSNCDRILNIPEPVKIHLHVGKYVSICLMLCIWLNMTET